MTAVVDPPTVSGPVARRPRRTVRRLRIAGLSSLGGLLVYVLLGLHFFVFPGSDPLPVRADVAVVLGGPTPERLRAAARMLHEGRVGAVLVSTPGPEYQALALCSEPHVTCRVPVPMTTRGEARMLRAEAATHVWRSAIVTTQAAHLDRAHLILQRCFAGSLFMLDSGEAPAGGWVWEYAYQTTATVKAWFVTTTC